MSTATNNGSTQRKQLSDQLDRLDGILDGLAEALNGAVADAVRDVIARTTREAVHAAVTEVLSSPELLRAALARHEPPVAATAAHPEITPRRSLKDHLRGARDRAGSTMRKAAAGAAGVISGVWTRSLDTLRDGRARLFDSGRCVVGVAKSLPGTLIALGAGLWRSRRTSSIAAAVGVACAAAAYYSCPAVAGVVGGIAGTALTATGMVLAPLWRVLSGSEDRRA